MNPILTLNDAELDELDDFLLSDDTPENCMNISVLDGFFAALVLNPRLTMPSEYLPWIWDMEEGEDGPSFASVEQANHIMGLVMRYYNGVLDAVNHARFSPLFYTLSQEDGSEFFDAEGWSEGFMRGVFLYVEPWKEIFENHRELLAPMVLLGTETGWDTLESRADAKTMIQEAYEAIAGVVVLLNEYFSPQREAEMRQRMVSSNRPAVSGKVGRNDPCPCGSGLKYKKCCSAPPTLH